MNAVPGYEGPAINQYHVGQMTSPSIDGDVVFRQASNFAKPEPSPEFSMTSPNFSSPGPEQVIPTNSGPFNVDSLLPTEIPTYDPNSSLTPEEEEAMNVRLTCKEKENPLMALLTGEGVDDFAPQQEEEDLSFLPSSGVVHIGTPGGSSTVIQPDQQPDQQIVQQPIMIHPSQQVQETQVVREAPQLQQATLIGEESAIRPGTTGNPSIGVNTVITNLGNLADKTENVVFQPDMVVWDGRCLGRYVDKWDVLTRKVESRRSTCMDLKFGNTRMYVQSQPIKNMTPIVVDELKELFGLNKLGTHHIYFGRGKTCFRLIRQSLTPNGMYKESALLADITKVQNMAPYLVNEIQRIFVFRHLVGLNSTSERCVSLREDDNGVLRSYSMIETTIDPLSPKKISQAAIKKWFTNFGTTPRDVFVETFGLGPRTDVDIISTIRSKTENVFRRYDPDNIHYVKAIASNCERLIEGM